jgi:hypothetical protein
MTVPLRAFDDDEPPVEDEDEPLDEDEEEPAPEPAELDDAPSVEPPSAAPPLDGPAGPEPDARVPAGSSGLARSTATVPTIVAAITIGARLAMA